MDHRKVGWRFGGICAAALALSLGAGAAQAAPKRIVALTPFTANIAADLGVRPVAIGETLGGNDRFSPKLDGVPRLGLSHPNGPNLEQLAQRNPQLVLSAPIWRRGHAGMRRLKMRVLESDPRSVHEIGGQVKRIGRAIGRSAAADRLARRMSREVAAATRGIKRRPRVLVIMGVGRASYAMLESSWGGDVVRRAGGRLLTQGLRAGGGYARISDELVVRRNPDVIIAVPHGSRSSIPALARFLKNKPAWRKTKAARRGRIYVSTGNSLLQAWSDVGKTIRDVRRSFLKN